MTIITNRQKKQIKSKLRYYARVLKYWCFGFYVKKDGYYYIKCPPYSVSCKGWRYKGQVIDHVICKPANPLEIDLYPNELHSEKTIDKKCSCCNQHPAKHQIFGEHGAIPRMIYCDKCADTLI